jgi:hypothetical protein
MAEDWVESRTIVIIIVSTSKVAIEATVMEDKVEDVDAYQ